MARTSALSLLALALAASSAHALPSANTVPKPQVVGGKPGRFSLPAVKVNATKSGVEARGLRSSANVGSEYVYDGSFLVLVILLANNSSEKLVHPVPYVVRLPSKPKHSYG